MKRAILSAAAFILTAACLHAQTIAGTWQGALPIGATGQGTTPGTGNPRLVVTIAKNADGSYHGSLALIDRGASVPLTSVTFSAPNFTLNGSNELNYRGK